MKLRSIANEKRSIVRVCVCVSMLCSAAKTMLCSIQVTIIMIAPTMVVRDTKGLKSFVFNHLIHVLGEFFSCKTENKMLTAHLPAVLKKVWPI